MPTRAPSVLCLCVSQIIDPHEYCVQYECEYPLAKKKRKKEYECEYREFSLTKLRLVNHDVMVSCRGLDLFPVLLCPLRFPLPLALKTFQHNSCRLNPTVRRLKKLVRSTYN